MPSSRSWHRRAAAIPAVVLRRVAFFAHRRRVLRCRPRGVSSAAGALFSLLADRSSARARKRVRNRRKSPLIPAHRRCFRHSCLKRSAVFGDRRRLQKGRRPRRAGTSLSGARRIRTADLLGAIRGGGQSYAMQEIANFQVVSSRSMGPSTSDPCAVYARICGDVIRVGNFWREVPEIEEGGSSWPTSLANWRSQPGLQLER